MIQTFQYGQVPNETLFIRSPLIQDVSAVVAEIIADVREHGDEALFRLTEQFDRARLTSLLVSDEEIDAAWRAVSGEYKAVLQLAYDNIAEYHRQQIRPGFSITRPNGVVLGQKVTPIARVGLYVPNGTAAYPSSLLMNCVPAKLAGCGMLVIVTPPGPDGSVDPAILAAAKIAGVDRIYKIGGAQAVAALAYGTETVPAVDKIVGPGNAYVAEAKKQVFGKVAIDTIAGPSEVLIVADDTSDPAVLAADMLAQAEHDVMATSVLVTDSRDLAAAVAQEQRRSCRFCRARRSPARALKTTEKSSSAGIWPTPLTAPTKLRRSIWRLPWTIPSAGWAAWKTRAPSSSASTRRRRWATISPGRTTPCPPRARRNSAVPCRWTIL